MEEITVVLEDGSEVELYDIDVGVSDEVITFYIEGVVRGVDAGVLDSISEKSLKPTGITFDVDAS